MPYFFYTICHGNLFDIPHSRKCTLSNPGNSISDGNFSDLRLISIPWCRVTAHICNIRNFSFTGNCQSTISPQIPMHIITIGTLLDYIRWNYIFLFIVLCLNRCMINRLFFRRLCYFNFRFFYTFRFFFLFWFFCNFYHRSIILFHKILDHRNLVCIFYYSISHTTTAYYTGENHCCHLQSCMSDCSAGGSSHIFRDFFFIFKTKHTFFSHICQAAGSLSHSIMYPLIPREYPQPGSQLLPSISESFQVFAGLDVQR